MDRPRTPRTPRPAKSAKSAKSAKAPSPARAATRRDAPAEARIARRERRRERSREEIVDAARRVLLERGVADTTLEAVAREVGLTKAALYYYYPSKDALLFEIIFGAMAAQSHAIHEAVARAKDGGAALRAIIRSTFTAYAARLDDFRLTFLHGQVARPGSVHAPPELLARIRPLNDLAFAGASELLAADAKLGRNRARVDPRMMAFLANIAAIGLLTVKGAVESVGDPLLYSDEDLVEGLSRIFETAARP